MSYATDIEHVITLTQRRDWLTARIAAKLTVNWDVEWDTRERDALTWAIDRLRPLVGDPT